jgi:hypothetical protein
MAITIDHTWCGGRGGYPSSVMKRIEQSRCGASVAPTQRTGIVDS